LLGSRTAPGFLSDADTGEFRADDRPRDLSEENLQADVLEISFDRRDAAKKIRLRNHLPIVR
jgi:hypothetical protein